LAYLLAISSAVLYGAADFLGGLAARRTTTIAVVILSQSAGAVLLGVMLPFLPAAEPSASDMAWGSMAGLTGGVGVALLYRALAVGKMAVVAPTTAVCAVVIPVVVVIMFGERPGTRALIGIGLAIIAIILVSQQPARDPVEDTHAERGVLPPGIVLALLSGVAIGLFFLSIARTRSVAGLWPLVAARVTSVSLFCVIAAVGARSVRLPARAAKIAVGGGVLDMLANALYLVASRYAPLSAVVTLSSLYPASTVLLARVFLSERLSAWQGVGLAAALGAVILIVN
jgi:drug/metabolite transporter (DMT)-like permease